MSEIDKDINVPNKNDTISRRAALDALGEKPLAWMESEYAQGLQNQWVWDVNALKALPSAQPEWKRGKWIDYANSHCECSVCHTEWNYFQNEVECFEFCPNCGANMREVDDERPD